jgi:alpha-galactosidase
MKLFTSRFFIAALAVFTILTTTQTAWAGGKPLKIYIMTGQSNMQGKARPSTFPAMATDPQSKALHDRMVDAQGNPRVFEDVRIAAMSADRRGETTNTGPLSIGYGGGAGEGETAFGPELAFGATLYDQLEEPILIIKASWGGKSLNTDFRSPSAGPYYKNPQEVQDRKTNKGTIITAQEQIAQKVEATGRYYRLLMQHVNTVLADPGKYHPAYDKDAGYEIAGFVWFQGWNDLVGPYPAGANGVKDYSEYSQLLAHFIRDVRKDLNAPNLPFVIGVLGVGGNQDASTGTGAFQNAMAAPAQMPEFKGNVVAVRTGDYWDHKLGDLDGRMWNNVEKSLSRQMKSLSREEADSLKARLIKEQFTDEELKYLQAGRSNAGFHYLGSAKIYSRIGEAFAKALIASKGTAQP